jgi:hypothetical protein
MAPKKAATATKENVTLGPLAGDGMRTLFAKQIREKTESNRFVRL